MTTNLLWFVLAGFLLGFATSTLWEWLYFRKVRLRRLEERTRDAHGGLRSPEEAAATERSASAEEPAWSKQAYRSPGVFLESEGATVSGSDREPDLPPLQTVEDDDGFTPPTVAAIAAPRPGGPPARRRQEQLLAELRRTSDAVATKSEPVFPRRKAAVTAAAQSHSATEPPAQDAVGEPVALQAGSEAALAPTVDAPQGWRSDPRLTQPSKDYPDDLCKIKGIGDVYRQRLFRAGFFTWHQIAEADTARLRQATGAYPSSNVEEWPVQARALIAKYGRAGAVYTGPLPDELTKILGIGPVSAQTLYRAGICTYEQLASSSVEALAALFPVAVAGDQPDFQAWIDRAARLADQKPRP
jgi:predicted flap endonuclease-1-like 5' DNA nuclease